MTGEMTAERRVRYAVLALAGVAFLCIAFGFPLRPNAANDWFRVGDWLINYDGGFIRRGVLGDLFIGLGALTGLLPGIFVLVFVVALYAVFYGYALRLFLASAVTLPRLLVMLSPAFLLFTVHDMKGGYRKEVFLFAVLAAAVYHGLVARHRPALAAAGLAVAMPLLVLTHEMLFCALPFALFVIAMLELPVARRLRYAAATAVASAAALLAVLAAGKADTAAICAPLLAHGQSPFVCTGAIYALSLDTAYGWNGVVDRILTTHLLWAYVAGLVLSFFPLLLALRELSADAAARRYALGVAAATAASFVLFVPIFLVANDWGRFILVLATGASLLVLARPAPPVPAGAGSHLYRALLLAVLYGGLWQIDHFEGLEGPVAKWLGL